MAARFDHVVVHIDNNESILSELKTKTEPLGIPFEPTWGKGTKGFKAANIWIGRQYFEIIRLLRPDGGGWEERWVQKYNQGKRGVFCLFLAVSNIEKLAKGLQERGVAIDGPKRITFKAFFGLFKKVLPWKLLYLPAIPGTDLEVGFIDYDPDPKDRIKQYLVPNADVNGITGISSAEIRLPLAEEAMLFLGQVFSLARRHDQTLTVPLDGGTLTFLSSSEVKVQLIAQVKNPDLKDGSFTLENVTLLLE